MDIYKYVSKYHFPIVGFNANSNKEVIVGTCVLITISERVFLITASHVMNERHNVKDKELWIWNYSDGSKITITEDIIGHDNEDVPHWHDIAIVEMNITRYETFNTPEFHENCFLGLERIILDLEYSPSTMEENGYLVVGYPSSKNKILQSTNKKPKLFIHLTEKVDIKQEEPTAESLLTTSVRWDNDNLTEKGVKLPKPQGMSGGGIWLLSNNTELNPMLYAISVAHIGAKKTVVAIKISVVLSILKYYFPSTSLDGISLPVLIKDGVMKIAF